MVAAILAVAALAVACAAIFSVGRVGYPIDVASNQGTEAPDLSHDRRRVRDGIRLTVLALILIVIAALSGWWPSKTSDPAKVTLSDTTGQAWRGPIVGEPDSTVSIRTVQGTGPSRGSRAVFHDIRSPRRELPAASLPGP